MNKCKECRKDFEDIIKIVGYGKFCQGCVEEMAWMYLGLCN